MTPSPTSQSGVETGDESAVLDSQSETATSLGTPGLLSSKENTLTDAEHTAEQLRCAAASQHGAQIVVKRSSIVANK